ncbi:MAG: hypothetical protein IPK16_27350 [Anaerolineales bacterium]|nr:hypothetical protein [Anaerolineales bacterium]
MRAPSYWAALVTLVVLGSYPYLTASFTEVTPPTRPVAVFGDHEIAILDATLAEPAGSEQAQLTIVFQVLRPLAIDYNVFFQALTGTADTEQVVAQVDLQPLGDAKPATVWRPGEILTASYELDLANAPQSIPLHYYFGFYDWRDGRRMVVDNGLDDKLVFRGR